jgi:hypothetical protein
MFRRKLFPIPFLFFFLIFLSSLVLAEDWTYRMHQGDTLTELSQRFLKPEFTPEMLQVYNGIIKDREIPIGTEIRVPVDWMSQKLAGVEVRYAFGDTKLFRRGESEPESISPGTVLNAGDRISTADKSAISLKFADGSHLLVGPESEVVFDALSIFEGQGMLDTRIRLQRGRVENRIKPIGRPGSRYQIHTPAAVTVVRGTDFRVSVDAQSQQTRSEVTEGKVDVTGSGETVAVNAGEGSLIEQGQPPTPPRRLLPAPDLSILQASYQLPMPEVEWQPLSGAVSYRVQLLDENTSLLYSQLIEEPRVKLPGQPDGSYQLRVRAIDDAGFEGLSARHDFELTLPPPPEPAPAPEPKTVAAPVLDLPLFWGPWIQVNWQPAEGAWSHRLLFARELEFESLIFEQLTQASGAQIPLPPPGVYYLAVEALMDDSTPAIRSQAYRLVIPARRW